VQSVTFAHSSLYIFEAKIDEKFKNFSIALQVKDRVD